MKACVSQAMLWSVYYIDGDTDKIINFYLVQNFIYVGVLALPQVISKIWLEISKLFHGETAKAYANVMQ